MPVRALHDEIREANRAYLALPRHEGDARAILARKLETAFWRRATLDRLLRAGESEVAEPDGLAEAILALGLHLGGGDLDRLRRIVGGGEPYGRVLAQQGVRWPRTPEVHDLAGPDVDLKIQANRDSPWPLEKWRKITAFSEYRFEGGAIHYRGLVLWPGDVILANVNLDGNFVYSSLSDPKCVFTHSAVVTVFQEGARRFPAVVETYEKGVRAIPLSIFLNARFLAYGELYRHRGLTLAHGERLAAAAAAMVRDTRGYNCTSWSDDRAYLSCTAVGRFLLEDVGLDGVGPRSAIVHPRVRENLALVGYGHFEPFFTPVDYLLNPYFTLVGVVDNNQFDRLLARELVEQGFRRGFETRRLEPRLLPPEYLVNRFALGQIRARTALGGVISRAVGFTPRNLPKGPDAMMAGIVPAEKQFGKAVRKLLPAVATHVAREGRFSFEETMADPHLQDLRDQALRLRWLVS